MKSYVIWFIIPILCLVTIVIILNMNTNDDNIDIDSNQLAIKMYNIIDKRYKDDIVFSPFGMIHGISYTNDILPSNYTQSNITDKQSIIVNMSYIPDDTIQGVIDNYEDIKRTGVIQIDFINPETNQIQEHIDYTVSISSNVDVFGPTSIIHTANGTVHIPVQFIELGRYIVNITVEGILFQIIPKEIVSFVIDTDIPYDSSTGLIIDTNIIGDMIVSDISFVPLYDRYLLLYEYPEVFFGNNSINVMYDRYQYNYGKYNDIEILQIPFKNNISLYIVQSQNDIKDVENVMSVQQIQEWQKGMKLQNVTLFIPEIIINTNSDLTRLSYDLKLNNEYQYHNNSTVSITGVDPNLVDQSYIDESQDMIQFNAFRPFIFFVQNDNDIIMMGKMVNTEY